MKTAIRRALLCALMAAASVSSPVLARDILVLTGVSGSSRTQYYYVGGLIPVQKETLAENGLLVRLWAAYLDVEYDAAGPGTPTDLRGGQYEAAIGYGYSLSPNTRISGFVGAWVPDMRTSPNDPTRAHDRSAAVKVQLEGSHRTGNIGFSAMGSYVFDAQDYWTRVRAGYYLGDTLQIGPELGAFGGRRYDKQQFGAFIDGFRLFRNTTAGLSLGAERDARMNGLRVYGGLNVAVRF